MDDLVKALVDPLAAKMSERLKGKIIVLPGSPLKVKDAAKKMGLSVPHLNVLIREGKVKKCPGTPTRIPLEEVSRMNSAEC